MPRRRLAPLLARTSLALLLLAPACSSREAGDATPPDASGDAPAAASAAADPYARYDAATFHATLGVFGASFSPDESSILISTDAAGVFNLYSQPVAGGEPRALTSQKADNLSVVSYFPRDERVLYLADKGGNELDHIFVAEPGKAPLDLTPGDAVKASFVGWSRDDAALWVQTNERDPRFFDLYRYDAETYARTMVFQNDAAWSIAAVDRGGRWLALGKQNDNRDSDVYLVDLAAKKPAPALLSRGKEPAAEAALTFSTDGKTLYYATDAHGEFAEVWAYDLKKKSHAPYHKAAWDVTGLAFSENGKYRVVTTNEDARTRIEITEVATGAPVALPALPAGDVLRVSFSRSESKLAFYASTDRSSPDLHVVDLTSGEHRQLTRTMSPSIDPEELVEGQVVRYASYDGVEVPGILYRPREASGERKVPALLWMHGGPGGQSRRGYSASIQHLVNHGYAVFAVNNRGSSGYGKTFFHLDDRGHGKADLDDCVSARDYLRGLEWIDGERIGIAGGSYGGYLTLAALAFRPEAFAVGVDIFGVANWIRTLESIPPWWASFRSVLMTELGDPAVDRARLEAASPLLHADQIRRPLLVIQGANDPRVLKVESDEIVAAVKLAGVPVDYVVFADEGHGFRKRVNRIAADDAMLRFLDTHLRRR